MTQDFKNISKIWEIFVILLIFELAPNYPNIDSSHWLREGMQWITDKGFREKIMVYLASTLSSRIFLLKFGFCLFLLLFS